MTAQHAAEMNKSNLKRIYYRCIYHNKEKHAY